MRFLLITKRCLILLAGNLVFLSIPLFVFSQDLEGRKFEVGAHFTTLGVEDPHSIPELGIGIRREFGFGSRFGFNLNKYVALEAEINLFPRDYRMLISDEAGGRITQGLFGVKAGVRKGRFGIFGKARPGFQTSGHSSVARFPNGDGPDPTNPFGFEVVRAFQPTLDLGGVFEYYPSGRWIVRTDVGDTITRYRPLPFICFPSGTPCPVVPITHKLQVNVGIGFRF